MGHLISWKISLSTDICWREGKNMVSSCIISFSILSSPLFNLLPSHPECRQSQPSCKRSYCGSDSSGGLGLCHAPSHSDNPLKLDSGQSNWKTAKCDLMCGMGTGIALFPIEFGMTSLWLEMPDFNRFVYFISLALSHKRKKETFLTLPHPIFLLDLVANLFSPDLVLITTQGHHRGACNPFTYHHFSSEISDFKALLSSKSAEATG